MIGEFLEDAKILNEQEINGTLTKAIEERKKEEKATTNWEKGSVTLNKPITKGS